MRAFVSRCEVDAAVETTYLGARSSRRFVALPGGVDACRGYEMFDPEYPNEFVPFSP